MSILIKGMEMPKNCAECPCRIIGYTKDYCNVLGKFVDYAVGSEGRRDDCPLIELPPHGRLIDADELMRQIQLYIDEYELYVDENGFHCEKWCAMKETEMAINNAPTVIEASEAET